MEPLLINNVMFYLPNAISALRLPLSLLFLVDNLVVRLIAIVGAMLTDYLDGFLARRVAGGTSRFGAILDPIMDKFFVLFCSSILVMEGALVPLQMLALISRDIFLLLFALYLVYKKAWRIYEIRAIRWGKWITAGQFCVLFALSLHYTFSWLVYDSFVALALFFVLELFIDYERFARTQKKSLKAKQMENLSH